MKNKKIYDCFIFFNEFELLKLRLDELYPSVDHFVICEATVTFRGQPKPLHFNENKAAFAAYSDKIIHVVVDDIPGLSAHQDPAQVAGDDPTIWGREHAQRNALRRGPAGASPDDIVIISDCDEIIRPETIQVLRENSGYFLLDMPMFQFYLNMRSDESGWNKVFAYSYGLDQQIPDYNKHRLDPMAHFARFAGQHQIVQRAGWHFTFLGGQARVQNKLQSYSHTDGWQRRMWDDSLLAEQMVALRAVGGGKPLQFCRVDETFPGRVQRDLPHYQAIGFVKDEWERLQELEGLWASADRRNQDLVRTNEIVSRLLAKLRRHIKERGFALPDAVNLLPASSSFAFLFWSPGMQSHPAALDPSPPAPAPVPDNAVMCHRRDAPGVNADTNVGYFGGIPVLAGAHYTASCYVWLSPNFAGDSVELQIDNTDVYQSVPSDLRLRGTWQRLRVIGRVIEGFSKCNVVLRVKGAVPCAVWSSCWQLEDGGEATEYRPGAD